VQLTEAARILADDLKQLRGVIAEKARQYKMTPMIGRSHGIHAEPVTFGLKLALMYDEFGRAEERLAQTTERIRVGKLSGAVGTHAHLDPRLNARFASGSASRRRRCRRRSSSAIAMRSSAPRWR
jgi:adenylosuccinate lyase